MKPYYEHGDIVIYHGDCREVLPEIEADVVVTDPPYGETALAWDMRVEWLGQLIESLKTVWVFGSFRSLLPFVHGATLSGWVFAQDLVWEKHNGTNPLRDRFRRVHELLIHLYRGEWGEQTTETPTTPDAVARAVRRKKRPPQWGKIGESHYLSIDGGPRLQRSVIHMRSEHGRAVHPTQNPVGLCELPILYSCPAKGVVLDPFCGSGSTLVAARQTKRRAIGIEIEERYCEIAAKRLAQEVFDFPGVN